MGNYTLKPTPKTPRLSFDKGSGEFEISGRSIPENSIEFYRPLMGWLEDYVKRPAIKTVLTINLEYFNTSSSKCLVEVFRKLEMIRDTSEVKVMWHYEEEDEDMLESGEDFKKIIKVPIDLVMVSSSH